MDEFYDDDLIFRKGEGWQINKNKKKNLVKNPNGPYTIEDFLFDGILWNSIVIENISHDEFKVTANTESDDVDEYVLSNLRRYLHLEGFELAARNHNLFW
jgi:hypothetical protein